MKRPETAIFPFHILVRVPSRPAVLPEDASLVALVRETQGDGAADSLADWLGRWREQGNEMAAEQERERWFRQMWDLSPTSALLH